MGVMFTPRKHTGIIENQKDAGFEVAQLRNGFFPFEFAFHLPLIIEHSFQPNETFVLIRIPAILHWHLSGDMYEKCWTDCPSRSPPSQTNQPLLIEFLFLSHPSQFV
jgi:hypothetical protein